MGNITEKAKKKKVRQEKAKNAALIAVPATLAFVHASSALYLREIYNIKTLLPSWKVGKADVVFQFNDFVTVLSQNLGLKLLVDKNLLVTEQLRQVAVILLLVVVVYLLGKKLSERVALFMFMAGIWGLLYYAFLFALLRWPSSLNAKDVLTLAPLPVIVPVYIPILMSAGTLAGGFYLLFKKKV